MAGRNTVEIILSARDQASRAVRQAFGSVRESASAALDVVETSAKVAGAALLALTGIVGKVGVSYNAMMEQSNIAWETILGSQEEAKKTLQELQVMGAKTPFEFEGLDRAAKLLNMAGFEGDNLFKTLTSVGDAVSAVGGGQEELEGISMAIFQMASKGKISAEEINQLAERGIPAWQMIADAQGKSVQEIMKMSENGKLFAKDVLPQLTEQLGERFGGAMDKQSKTFNGMLSTMRDNLKMISAELTKGAFEQLKGVMEGILPIMDSFLSNLKDKGLKGMIMDILPPEAADAATKISEGLNMVKGVLESFLAMATGDVGKSSTILTSLGLSPEQVAQAQQIMMNVVSSIQSGFETAKSIFSTVFSFISGWIQSAMNLFKGEGNLGESFVSIFNTIKSIALPILQDAVAFIKDQFAKIKQFWDENGAQIISAVQNFFAILAAIFKVLAPVILFIIGMVWDSVKGVISGALNVIMGLIKIFAGLFTGDFSKMWEGIKQLFFGAIEFVWNLINLLMFGRILGGIKAMATKGIELFKVFWDQSVNVFKNLDTYIWNIISGFVSKIVGRFRGFVDEGISIFNTLRTFGANIFQSLWSAISTVAGNIYSAVIGRFSSMVTGARFQFQGILDTAKNIFGAITNAITHPLQTAVSLVKSSIDKIKGFFSNMKVKIPLPHFDVKMNNKKIAGVNVPVPDLDVNWYDKGGVFYGPQIIGVGEKRPEFVGALSDLEAIIRKVIGEKGSGNTYHITVNGNDVDITEERLIRLLQNMEVLYG
ncbi:tape measure protein [Bacillus sp. 03113]|uniref:tape measure protein n=1 Tax=Bacillus sp. 03113 TaxID=2578211 RepID=UPI0015E88EDA|nr:tape measure protein [Bacillus sp. 03113]